MRESQRENEIERGRAYLCFSVYLILLQWAVKETNQILFQEKKSLFILTPEEKKKSPKSDFLCRLCKEVFTRVEVLSFSKQTEIVNSI